MAGDATVGILMAGAATIAGAVGARFLHPASGQYYLWLAVVFGALIAGTVSLIASACHPDRSTRLALYAKSTLGLTVIAFYLTWCSYHPWADMEQVGRGFSKKNTRTVAILSIRRTNPGNVV